MHKLYHVIFSKYGEWKCKITPLLCSMEQFNKLLNCISFDSYFTARASEASVAFVEKRAKRSVKQRAKRQTSESVASIRAKRHRTTRAKRSVVRERSKVERAKRSKVRAKRSQTLSEASKVDKRAKRSVRRERA